MLRITGTYSIPLRLTVRISERVYDERDWRVIAERAANRIYRAMASQRYGPDFRYLSRDGSGVYEISIERKTEIEEKQ